MTGLRGKVAARQPNVGGGAGTGLSAKCQEEYFTGNRCKFLNRNNDWITSRPGVGLRNGDLGLAGKPDDPEPPIMTNN